MKTYKFIKDYVKDNLRRLKLVYPDESEDVLKEYLMSKVKDNLTDPECTLDNNYIHKQAQTSLLNVYEYMEETKPIIAGYGVLFKNQNFVTNPHVIMLQKFKKERSAKKKEMYSHDPRSYEYLQCDIEQTGIKRLMNSYYGGSGNKYSAFYNLYTAASTTSTGQSLISTAETAVEMFMCNNVKWYNYGEFLLFTTRVLSEDYSFDLETKEITDEMLHDKLLNTFKSPTEEDSKMILRVINSISYEDKLKLYYKNNLYEFLEIPKMTKMLHKIFKKVNVFRDPNHIPDEIKDDLPKLWDYLHTYVMYDYPIYNRIYRLKFEQRMCTATIDTDSNMYTVNKWINYVLDNFLDDSNIDYMEKKFIAVNTIAYLISTLLNDYALKTYSKSANLVPEFSNVLNMKNEFYYTRMILTATKKRYIGALRLREGNEIYPEKIDQKGLDYIKSSAPPKIKEFFENLVSKYILFTDNIDVSIVLRKLDEIKTIVYNSIMNGEVEFLNSASVKEPAAYKNPFEEQGLVAAFYWNWFYPDLEITFPDTVYIVKLNLCKAKELDDFKHNYPNEYAIYEKYIENSDIKSIKKRKLNIIGIPINDTRIPEWCIPYLSIDEMVNDNISKFYPILGSMNINLITTRSNTTYYSNIISF